MREQALVFEKTIRMTQNRLVWVAFKSEQAATAAYRRLPPSLCESVCSVRGRVILLVDSWSARAPSASMTALLISVCGGNVDAVLQVIRASPAAEASKLRARLLSRCHELCDVRVCDVVRLRRHSHP